MRAKRALYNVITNCLLQLVIIVSGFIVPKIIIDYFGSDVNGLIVSITQFLGYITLLESGFGPVVKAALYKPIAQKNKKEIAGILKTSELFFRGIAGIFVLYIIVLCFVFPSIAGSGFDALFTISMVIAISASILAEYFFGITYRLFLEAKQKMYIISIIQISTYVLSTLAVVILALSGAEIIVIKLVSGLLFLLRPIVQNVYIRKKYHISLRDAPKGYVIKQKWDGLAQHIAAVIHNNTDIVVLTIFTSFSEVSVYSVYNLVTAGVKKIVQIFNNGMDSSFGDMIANKEEENLKKKFLSYELLFMIICTILFSCAFVLITPFVNVYTSGVDDANYMRPLFGYLLVLSDFVWAVRLPYSTLILAAGHFKETRRGAWIEAITNIVISVILVFNFGIIGVAIGTLVAMSIRTIEFVCHVNKHILKESFWKSFAKICVAFAVLTVVSLITFGFSVIPEQVSSFSEWFLFAFLVVLITTPITLLSYGIIYRRDFKFVMKYIASIIKRKKRK